MMKTDRQIASRLGIIAVLTTAALLGNGGCIGPMRWAAEDVLFNNNVPRQRSDAEVAAELRRTLGLGLGVAGHPANLNSPLLSTVGGLVANGQGQYMPAPGYRWVNPGNPNDLRVVRR